MTVAKFLADVALIFEQPAFNDRHMARQCRDYGTIANLETAEVERLGALLAEKRAAEARAGLAAMAKKRAAKAAK